MEPITVHTGKSVALMRNDVDTDQIIPKQFLKNILKTGFGIHLFYDWRYLKNGRPNPDFILNQPTSKGATILVTGNNFGCGSSREHAAWALKDWGFKVIIAGGYSDIFYMNCTKNGLLPIVLPQTARDILAKATPEETITIDLVHQRVKYANHEFTFEINPTWKDKFLKGTDDIDLTMTYEDQITAFEAKMPVFD
ncbi:MULTISPECIES: 3-isopropylmalate dehydratase small subunit [Loigolactobacillus]|uniref:3-isopropylmalate dehydratase small subunit n=1 Tax=Loigolactobacillus backii TaxID=375175 RepID=A0A192H160_9LACO|nr:MULTISPECIES: 3-isopropylmalate dehydratase small subunit [Loigolactobacillus]ANK60483.1 3-isopropylmalate dehydratase small subunit [Loigolactobacillus backii]ANK62018.1 3-isopropylmalate dehydratase small subunit [Loigolactobacillus backii]ANK65365.1 3-isopropylmalate dehydratase small subunit [Loigolactobacillus backii]ANK67913.1 3-isopropylmalate dehydratase small subunit [Loigolactobacillus backii]ANK68788.1 3-isopropylmalate dehydratase small subunit [Loigolactobacillus backii]